ncbi:hypothetical protein [Mycobacterium phage Maco7]|nr:hypothetical protein [Mycobacterium phage Maco7]
MSDAGGWVTHADLTFERLKGNSLFAAMEAAKEESGPPDPRNNPLRALRYARTRRNVIVKSYKQRPLIRVWDKNHDYIGRITAEKSVDWQELMYSPGSAKILLRRNNWLSDFLIKDVRADEDLHITIDPRPTKRSWETRWGGKVTAAHIRRTSDGAHEIELECISNWTHWQHLIFQANPVLPPEIQLPKIFIFPMNIRTSATYTAILNLARNYVPLLSIPTNLFNPGHWLVPIIDPALPTSRNPGLLGNFSMLDWPVQMAFVNPAIDQSRFSFVTARWTMADVATDPLFRDAGCFLRAYTFLTEDETSPHRELADLIGERAARPNRNCVVLAVLNKSGHTGPTGTLLDGIIDLVASTLDDGITEMVFPIDRDSDGITDPLFRKWLGVAPAKPKVVFRDGEYSGIIESDRINYKAKARTIATGGKSPGWVNQAITFGIRYALSQLAQVINYGLGAYQQPGTEGLDNLYQGQLDDTFLAFQKYTDPKRVLDMGAMALLEHMEQGSGTAWTVSGTVTLRMGHWKTRPRTVCKVSVVNGYPWLVYEDYELGDRVGFELAQVIFTDQVSGIKWSYSASQAMKCELAIGTDDDEEDPFARALRAIQTVWGVVGMVLGDGGSTF